MPEKKKPGDGKSLVDLEVEEISIVDASANRKRFSVMKQAEMDELTSLIKAFFVGDDEGARFVIAKAAAAELTPEAGAAIAEALKVLSKYLGDMPGEMIEALGVLLGAAPAFEPGAGGEVSKVAKFAEGGAFDTLFRSLVLVSRNPRMIEALMKADASRGEFEGAGDPEDEATPGRGVRKSIQGQEGDDGNLKKSATEVDLWPSV